ncbi:MAG: hypothetical protein AAFO69_04260 [Bacteroidota bacterium]
MKDKRTELANKLRQLDEEPMGFSWSEQDLWEDINQPKRVGRPFFWYAAACLGIAIVAGLWWNVGDQPQYSLTYEVAIEQVDGFVDLTSHIETSATEFIEYSCKEQLEVCESTEFKSLTKELAMLQDQINALDEMIRQYGNDPVFVKSRIQIENLKSEITNKLIQMVMS